MVDLVGGGAGGSVCCYIRLNINYVVREDLDNRIFGIESIETSKDLIKPNSNLL